MPVIWPPLLTMPDWHVAGRRGYCGQQHHHAALWSKRHNDEDDESEPSRYYYDCPISVLIRSGGAKLGTAYPS
jgi:hypothetical protein